jgi:hypothetical protein
LSAFGLSPDQDNLLTLIGLGLAASAVHNAYQRLMEGPPFPTRADVALGTASLNEVLCGVAGPASRKAPLMGILLLAALVAGATRPAASKSIHALRNTSERLSFDFHHRYGYLVDPGTLAPAQGGTPPSRARGAGKPNDGEDCLDGALAYCARITTRQRSSPERAVSA